MNLKDEKFQRVHIIVTGRVQGVGFRVYVKRMADSLGLAGWVKNVGYDRVETAAEGRKEILEQFLSMVLDGPRGSHVEEHQETWGVAEGESSPFEVRFF